MLSSDWSELFVSIIGEKLIKLDQSFLLVW